RRRNVRRASPGCPTQAWPPPARIRARAARRLCACAASAQPRRGRGASGQVWTDGWGCDDRPVKRLLASALAAVALAACGTDKQAEPKAPQPASEPSAAGVIRAWADALRGGDVEAAARYFAVPSLVSN